ARDSARFIDVVAALEPTFGGINLEDLKAPECFEIEAGLRARMAIPVFHDDQHGTAIISGAALLNGAEITGRKLSDLKIVISGAGASAIACANFYVSLGVSLENISMVDSIGVIYAGREQGMNQWKARFARQDDGARTRADALRGADLFLGLSKAGLCTAEMLKTMAPRPLVFALANPDPEIGYAEAKEARPDAIVATGRSDFPNQVNNVLGFPYVFRGALDVRAKEINEAMKIAAAHALAALAHEPVPDSVAEAYDVSAFKFGPDYIIPKPFDTRVLWWCAPAVAEAAMKSGAARLTLDLDEYRERLQRRIGGTQHTIMRQIVQRAKSAPKRIVFPDGDNIKVLRACQIALDEQIARPILLGHEKKIRQRAAELDLDLEGVEIINPQDSPRHAAYATEYLALRCRKGVTASNATRLVNRRIDFGMMMVRSGDADGLVAGLTSPYPDTIRPALQILGIRPDVRRATGMYMMLLKNGVKFFADATVNIDPDAETLADTAIQVADAARAFEVTPRIAMISFSNFGSAPHPESKKMAEAVGIVRRLRPDLEIDGEVQADIAVEPEKMRELFPFSRLTDEANVLIFPTLSAGNAAYKVLAALGGATAIGPILLGVNKPVTVLPRDANVDTIVSMTAYTVARSQS
ncbi:MAG TPA: phosphate acyltransferase, partial [Polyangia bacterium]|nr:phosphate acyltransferase [Polyangia bacterium]